MEIHMDLTMPKSDIKICHHCVTASPFYGYEAQNCPECGKLVQPLKDSEMTVDYEEPKGLNVLSLFDGMGCCYQALKDSGIEVKNYFASEIDKYAIQIAKKNHPDVKQIGDVQFVTKYMLPHHKIDLLTAGSPCQSFSVAGDGTGFDGKSALFFEFVRLIKELKPKYFLLENVYMKKEWQDIISAALGVKPIQINSALVSAQNRKRLYWTNIPDVKAPTDKGIILNDILETPGSYVKIQKNGTYRLFQDKASCLSGGGNSGGNHSDMDLIGQNLVHLGNATDINGHDSIKRVYAKYGKAPTLNTMTGGNRHPKVAVDDLEYRRLTPLECERLQTLPDNYTEGVSNSQRYKMLGNGWTVKVISHILKNIK